mgnify:CR=1 FL=1
MSICRDDLEAGQEGYKIVKRNGRYMLYTGTSFQVLDRVYYVETFSDITRDYENRDAQLRMFRMIMIIVMIVCLMLMAILNNMIVVPIRRLSKATKLVAGGRAGIRIRKRSKDEIGVLAEDFNRMSTSLNRTMKELEEKTKSQEMFTNNFAHELKTPLTSMIGYTRLIVRFTFCTRLIQTTLALLYPFWISFSLALLNPEWIRNVPHAENASIIQVQTDKNSFQNNFKLIPPTGIPPYIPVQFYLPSQASYADAVHADQPYGCPHNMVHAIHSRRSAHGTMRHSGFA